MLENAIKIELLMLKKRTFFVDKLHLLFENAYRVGSCALVRNEKFHTFLTN